MSQGCAVCQANPSISPAARKEWLSHLSWLMRWGQLVKGTSNPTKLNGAGQGTWVASQVPLSTHPVIAQVGVGPETGQLEFSSFLHLIDIY